MTLRSLLDEVPKPLSRSEAVPVFDPATEERISEFTDFGPTRRKGE
ncbi:hypothetical protein [Nocardia sp. NBC_01388]